MRRLFLLCVLMLLAFGVQGAQAYHHYSDNRHWSTETVQINGGGCSNPQCRYLAVYDRTGYTADSWKTNLTNALVAWSIGTNGRFQYARFTGPKFDIWTQTEPSPCSGACDGVYHWFEASEATPVGAVFIGRGCNLTQHASDSVGHIQKAVLCVDNRGAVTIKHELGHALGLTHRRIDANYNCDGLSIMCAFGEAPWTQIDAHDKAELNYLYAHTD